MTITRAVTVSETGAHVGRDASDPVSEGELLSAYAAGDREAAAALVERSYRGIYRALHRMCGGDEDLAADLTQETYRRAWKALAGFDGRSRFSTWAYRIAYTTFLNHLRRPRPVTALDEAPVDVTRDPAPGPDVSAQRGHEAERLRRAVLDLPDDLRDTVAARFWGELSVAEIARGHGVTAVAIRKRLKRAYSLLALTLSEEAS